MQYSGIYHALGEEDTRFCLWKYLFNMFKYNVYKKRFTSSLYIFIFTTSTCCLEERDDRGLVGMCEQLWGWRGILGEGVTGWGLSPAQGTTRGQSWPFPLYTRCWRADLKIYEKQNSYSCNCMHLYFTQAEKWTFLRHLLLLQRTLCSAIHEEFISNFIGGDKITRVELANFRASQNNTALSVGSE